MAEEKEIGEQLTVVAPDKRIAIAASKLSVHELLRLLQCDVHVAINRLQFACKTAKSNGHNQGGKRKYL